MKRKKKRKKRRPKTVLEKLQEKLEAVQRLTIIRRDGGCVLRGVIPHTCSKVIQADHLISRSYKSIFFDLRNMNCVCSTMNGIKGRRWSGWERIQRELERITNDRYGPSTVDALDQETRTPSGRTRPKDVLWVERTIDEYDRLYRDDSINYGEREIQV